MTGMTVGKRIKRTGSKMTGRMSSRSSMSRTRMNGRLSGINGSGKMDGTGGNSKMSRNRRSGTGSKMRKSNGMRKRKTGIQMRAKTRRRICKLFGQCFFFGFPLDTSQGSQAIFSEGNKTCFGLFSRHDMSESLASGHVGFQQSVSVSIEP